MYVVPTQPLIGVNNSVKLNQLTLAGGVGFIGEQKREDAFNFGLMCQGSSTEKYWSYLAR